MHTCEPTDRRSIFCRHCGKLLDPTALRSVRFAGFTGAQSTNPKVEQFWATGDPAVFAKPGAEDFSGLTRSGVAGRAGS